MLKTNDLRCPGCGAPQKHNSVTCEYCGRPVVITTVREAESLTYAELRKYADTYRRAYGADPGDTVSGLSLGICLYSLKLYDEAIRTFEKCIDTEFDNPELYYYLALSNLKGRKPFVVPRSDIDRIERYLGSAIAISPRGLYYYFFAYIRYDHHYRKMYAMSPDYRELLGLAERYGITEADKTDMFGAIGVARPAAL